MERISLLRQLSLGNSVAEFDQDLDRYFLETNTFRLLADDQIDIIAGDKRDRKDSDLPVY